MSAVVTAPTEHPAARDLAERHRVRWWEPLPWILAVAFYFLYPSYLGFGTDLLTWILFAISLDLALGYAGILTLGHAAFFGAGAYTVGMLAHHGIWNEPLTSLALAAFVVPFIFVFGPELLWKGPLWQTATTFATAAIALILLAGAIEHHTKWADAWWTRALLAIGALCMITPDLRLTALGACIVAVAIGANRLRRPAAA